MGWLRAYAWTQLEVARLAVIRFGDVSLSHARFFTTIKSKPKFSQSTPSDREIVFRAHRVRWTRVLISSRPRPRWKAQEGCALSKRDGKDEWCKGAGKITILHLRCSVRRADTAMRQHSASKAPTINNGLPERHAKIWCITRWPIYMGHWVSWHAEERNALLKYHF